MATTTDPFTDSYALIITDEVKADAPRVDPKFQSSVFCERKFCAQCICITTDLSHDALNEIAMRAGWEVKTTGKTTTHLCPVHADGAA